MSQPESYTAAQAADPSTPGQVLADIAALRPDLRPAVAGNPSTYPGLLDWLKGLGEPAVDAAIAARPAAPTQQLPAPAPQMPAPTQQMPATPPAPSWAGQATTSTPAPLPAPAAMQAGSPAPAYGGMPPQGMPPQGAYTPGYAGSAPPKKSRAGLIIGIVLGVLLLIGLGVFLLIKFVFDKASDAIEDLDPTQAEEYGDNAMLDALYDRCADGDWEACDDLYRETQANRDSEYFEFADTCGGAWEAGTSTFCVDAMDPDSDASGDDTGDDTGDEGDDTGDVDTGDYTASDLAYFESLRAACADGQWAACDELWWQSPSGSEYEAFAETCGGAAEGVSGDCSGELGGTPFEQPMARGSSEFLDVLWDDCEAGNAEACESLYYNSPTGSDYEAFAESQR